MAVIVMNIPSALGEEERSVVDTAIKRIGLRPQDVTSGCIYKSSLDARKRENIHFVNSVMLCLRSSDKEKWVASKHRDVRYFDEPVIVPKISCEKREGRTVIAGFGPAGIFCALLLSEYGYKPIVLERGADVDSRVKAVNAFWNGAELDTETNVQFGEGGAGTFSDGKLTTRIGDPLCRYVLTRLCEFGAPPEILRTAKPHIGTDKLRAVVRAMRQKIIENGGEVRFLTPLRSICVSDGRVTKAITSHGEINPSALVLAIGHSARDTFRMLLDSGVTIQPKPFSVGARIEHSQRRVNKSLYGIYADSPLLPQGEYQLSHRHPDGRAVYTFCMCPGGYVVASSSERSSIVTNGMSEYSRDSENANSALVVSVSPSDYGNNPMDGVEFASGLEKKAYMMSGSYMAPASTVGAFLGESSSVSVLPSYKPGVADVDLNKLFPKFVSDMMKEGIRRFSRELGCFGDMGAYLTAPETRTSSPVRILRGERFNAVGIDNLYPCGEGAGYAGGIVSAAVDGLRTALEIMKSYSPLD